MTIDHINPARAKRNPIPLKTRFEIFKRDEFTCQYCGATPPSVVLELDHFHPVRLGGGDEWENLITSCFDCNRGKGGREISEFSPPYSNSIEKISEARRQAEAYQQLLAEKMNSESEFAERIHEKIYSAIFLVPSKSMEERLRSIKMLMLRLDGMSLMHAATLASAIKANQSDRFKYFCGVCWRKIKGEIK